MSCISNSNFKEVSASHLYPLNIRLSNNAKDILLFCLKIDPFQLSVLYKVAYRFMQQTQRRKLCQKRYLCELGMKLFKWGGGSTVVYLSKRICYNCYVQDIGLNACIINTCVELPWRSPLVFYVYFKMSIRKVSGIEFMFTSRCV